MAIYPGATFKPTAFGGRTPRNKQGRGILHVAVNNAQQLAPWNANTWHFYVGKAAPDGSTDGSGGPAVCTQYVDTEYRAYGDVDANDDAIVIETAGGTGTSAVLNAEKWTRAQELRLADIMRWEAAQPGGAPLELLPDSKAGRRGWGPHRLGIKHSAGLVPGWWAPGGEVWSNALGKECPGDAKVRQVPGVIALARTGPINVDGWLTVDAEGRLWDGIVGRIDQSVIPPLRAMQSQMAGLSAAVSKLAEAVASGRDDLTAEELRAAVAAAISDAGVALRAVQGSGPDA